MSVVSLVKDLSMKKFNGITAVCFVDSVYSMLLYLLVYGKNGSDASSCQVYLSFSSLPYLLLALAFFKDITHLWTRSLVVFIRIAA